MKHYLALTILLVLAGCSTNRDQQNYLEPFYQAFIALKAQGEFLSKADAANLPYASVQANFNDTTPALMLMGYGNTTQQKWYSRNRLGFTTEDARVVQVYNLGTEVSKVDVGPMLEKFKISNMIHGDRHEVTATVDFLSLNRFDVSINLFLEADGLETRMLWGEPVNLLRISEIVSIPSMNYKFTNYYWKDPKTGFVWESIQKWGVSVPKIHYQVVKPWFTVLAP